MGFPEKEKGGPERRGGWVESRGLVKVSPPSIVRSSTSPSLTHPSSLLFLLVDPALLVLILILVPPRRRAQGLKFGHLYKIITRFISRASGKKKAKNNPQERKRISRGKGKGPHSLTLLIDIEFRLVCAFLYSLFLCFRLPCVRVSV